LTVSTAYYALVKNIRNYLVTLLETNQTSWLSGRVHKYTPRTDEGFPRVYVMPTNDSLEIDSASDNRYKIQPGFAIVLRQLRSSDPDTDIDVLISGTALLMSEIQQSITYYQGGGSSGDIQFHKLEIEDIDFEYQSPGITPNSIMESRFTVRAEKRWKDT
jgi:hypothetical protein